MARLSRLMSAKWLLSRLKLLKIALKTHVRSAIVSCTTCKENGHTSVKCWFGAETKLRNVVQQLAEAKMILKTKKSTAAEKRDLVAAKQTADGHHRGECHLVEIFTDS
jgi:hypothetical protein